MEETVTIMGLPFKRRRSKKSNTQQPSGSANAQTTTTATTMDRTPPFFRRRPSLPLSFSNALHAAQRSSMSVAVISPERAGMGHSTTKRTLSLDSIASEDDNAVVLDEEEEEIFLPSPNKPNFLSRSIVVREEPLTLEQAARVWFSRADDLVKSKEMDCFLSSSRELALVASCAAIRTVFLPVTIPLHLASTATGAVVGTCGQVFDTTSALIHQVARGSPPGGQDTSSFGFLHHALEVIPLTLKAVTLVKDGLGATLMNLVAPILGNSDDDRKEGEIERRRSRCITASGESSAENESFLDRLRLDYSPPVAHQPQQPNCLISGDVEKAVSLPAQADVSKYLLYVGDLGLCNYSEEYDSPVPSIVTFIDLEDKFADKVLTEQALSELVSRGLSLIFNVEVMRVQSHVNALSLGCVQWKPENSTERILRGFHDGDWIKKLEANVLIWSGRMQGRWGRGHDYPFFMARGIVKGSPRQFLGLLWDNARTSEYNKHSLGRSDLLVIVDGVLDGASTGTKVVKSETRVPFTGLSVVLATLMHVRPLPGPDDNGFVIVSRSLNCGRAGCHVGSADSVEKSNNEILWGVNILRRVPGKPHATDLTSVSQVATTLVPKFLAHRIGIMGVEDFFSAVKC